MAKPKIKVGVKKKRGRRSALEIKRDSLIYVNKLAENGDQTAQSLLEHHLRVESFKKASEQQIIKYTLRHKHEKSTNEKN